MWLESMVLSIALLACERRQCYIGPCLVVQGCGQASLMFCLEPDWA